MYKWGTHIDYDVVKPVTPYQINDRQIRKGDKAFLGKRYKLALRNYFEVLDREKDNQKVRKILLQKISNAYENDKNYKYVEMYLVKLLKHIEGEIKAEKGKEKKTKLEEEKKQIEEKIKAIDELINIQGK